MQQPRQVGTVICHFRVMKDHSKKTLADAAGVKHDTISRIERGESISLGSLLKICDQLKLDVCLAPRLAANSNEKNPGS